MITRRLAELMGGEAGARSTPGVGSVFWFTARMRRGDSLALSDANCQKVESGEYLRLRHAGKKVLLAEDNEINREVIEALLASVGIDVDVAVDGLEAIEKAKSGSHELILMDVQMPTMDGLEATRQIRTLPGWEHKPILALTANAFAEDRRTCHEAGMNDFMSKPVDVGVLYSTLLRWLSHEEMIN